MRFAISFKAYGLFRKLCIFLFVFIRLYCFAGFFEAYGSRRSFKSGGSSSYLA